MLAVIVPVIVLTLAFAWWFREGNPRPATPDWSYSGPVEMIVWSIPALVVLFLGGIGWISAHASTRSAARLAQAEPIDVEVVSLDWKWLFIYPAEGIASVNRLVVPAGQPIRFRLTSGTVMNSFFVPQLGSQIYTMAAWPPSSTCRPTVLATFPASPPNSAGRVFPTCVSWSRQCRPSSWLLARQHARHRRKARRRKLWKAWPARPRRQAGDVRQRGAGRVQISHPQRDPVMFGKLSWDAIPYNQPIPMAASLGVILAIASIIALVLWKGWTRYLWDEWITSVDHKRTFCAMAWPARHRQSGSRELLALEPFVLGERDREDAGAPGTTCDRRAPAAQGARTGRVHDRTSARRSTPRTRRAPRRRWATRS